MKRLRVLVAAAVLATAPLGLLGCISAPVVPPIGLIYTNMDAPISLGGVLNMSQPPPASSDGQPSTSRKNSRVASASSEYTMV